MHINVYNKDLQRIGYIGSWISLEWSEEYAGEGSFVLELPISADLRTLCEPDNYLQFSESPTEMWIQSCQVNENEGNMEVSGCSLNGILRYRFMAKEILAESNIVSSMRSVVNGIKGGWDHLTVDSTDLGITEKTKDDMSDMTALEMLKKLSESTDETWQNIGFRIRHDHDTKGLVFEVYRPSEDKRLLFSPLYGNADEIVISKSKKEYFNVAVAVQDGDKSAATYIFDKQMYSTIPTGSARRETKVENVSKRQNEDDSTYQRRLRQEGLKQLQRSQMIDTVSFKTNDSNLQLGQIAVLVLPSVGMKIKKRVTTIRISSDEGNISREITLGDPIQTRS